MAGSDERSTDPPRLSEFSGRALRDLIARLPLAVVHYDDDGKLRWANETARSMYIDEDHPQGHRFPLERLDAALRVPDVASSSSREAPAGTIRIAIVTDPALVERDAVAERLDGGGLLLAFPPTERPGAAVSREAEGRLATMLEHTHDIITVLGPDGTIRYSNPAAGALTGIRGRHANGESALQFVHPDDVDIAAGALADALANTLTGPIEVRLRFADGDWHPTEVFIDNLLDHASVGGLVVTIRDITEQRAHEEALQQSERRLRSLVENLSDVIVVLDAQLNVAYATPGIEAFIPAPAYTNIGESAFNDIHPDDVEQVAADIAELMEVPDSSTRMELRLGKEPDGWRWVEVTAVNRLDDPSVAGLVCTLRDVSDRRAAGEELRRAYEREREAAMKLRELDRLKDEFLATVSHELRTPLTSIAGFTQIVLRDQALGDQPRALLERVSRSARDMTSMIENLLDFSRLQAGRVAIDLQPLDVEAALTDLVDELSHHLSEHEVIVEADRCRVMADPAGFCHILRNLLVNAAKYSDPGSRITVSTSLSEDEVSIAVADQGIGISEKDQTAVFQSFFQADPGRTGRRGAGVGLNIARRYTQLQGGRLSLDSTPGAGSTFRVSLPRVADR